MIAGRMGGRIVGVPEIVQVWGTLSVGLCVGCWMVGGGEKGKVRSAGVEKPSLPHSLVCAAQDRHQVSPDTFYLLKESFWQIEKALKKQM